MKPTVIHSKGFKKDPLTKGWVTDDIPTVTIKKALIESTQDDQTMRSSSTPCGTAHLRLTYLHLSTNVADQSYALVDRDGTFDQFSLGTAVSALDGKEVLLQGDSIKPIHVVKGTFAIYSGVGSHASGSFNIAWEGIREQESINL